MRCCTFYHTWISLAWQALKGEGRIWACESTRGRKERNACEETIVFFSIPFLSPLHAQILPSPSPFNACHAGYPWIKPVLQQIRLLQLAAKSREYLYKLRIIPAQGKLVLQQVMQQLGHNFMVLGAKECYKISQTLTFVVLWQKNRASWLQWVRESINEISHTASWFQQCYLI